MANAQTSSQKTISSKHPPLFDEHLISLRRQNAKHTIKNASYIMAEIESYMFESVALHYTIMKPDEGLDGSEQSIKRILILGHTLTLQDRLQTLDPTVDITIIDPLDITQGKSWWDTIQGNEDQVCKFDFILDVMTVHWMNDPLLYLAQVKSLLKPNGFFTSGFLGGVTLQELRQTLVETDLALFGGAYGRVSPMIKPEGATRLVHGAGFHDPVVDHEEVLVPYPDLKSVVKDLRLMGETNALYDPHSHLESFESPHNQKTHRVSKSYYEEAHKHYEALMKTKEIQMTFDLVFMSGWGS